MKGKRPSSWPLVFSALTVDRQIPDPSLSGVIAKSLTDVTKGNYAPARNILDLLQAWGFDTYSYLSLGTARRPKIPPTRLMCKLPPALVRAYDDLGYHMCDITFLHALYTRTPIFYSDLHNAFRNAPHARNIQILNMEIRHLYYAFGIQDFYLIPVVDSQGVCLFSIALRNPAEIYLLNQIL